MLRFSPKVNFWVLDVAETGNGRLKQLEDQEQERHLPSERIRSHELFH